MSAAPSRTQRRKLSLTAMGALFALTLTLGVPAPAYADGSGICGGGFSTSVHVLDDGNGGTGHVSGPNNLIEFWASQSNGEGDSDPSCNGRRYSTVTYSPSWRPPVVLTTTDSAGDAATDTMPLDVPLSYDFARCQQIVPCILIPEQITWQLVGGGEENSPVSYAVLYPGWTIDPASPATLTLRLDADPDDAQDFDFSATGLSPGSFELDDDGDATNALSNERTFGNLAPGSDYAIDPGAVPGWLVESDACANGSSLSDIVLHPQEALTCTVVMSQKGKIVVKEDSRPDDPSASFDFTTGGGLSPSGFSLLDGGAPSQGTQSFVVTPGSGYSVSQSTPPSGWQLGTATCSDGSPISNVDVSAGETVTCTFINQRAAFDVPATASSLNVALVPDFRQTISTSQCSARGGAPSSHGLPDLPGGSNPDGSCNPPGFTPGTVAHFGTQASASASLTAVPGNLSTSADEGDVAVTVNATDVRGGSATGTDYNPVAAGPDLTLAVKFRLSDTFNGGSQDQPGTLGDRTLAVPVACTTTPSPTIGSTCSAATTLDGVTPGMVPEGKSSVLQSFRVRLLDSGADGVRNNTDDRGFAMQGVYIP